MAKVIDFKRNREELAEGGFTTIRGGLSASEAADVHQMSDAMSNRARQILVEALADNVSIAARALQKPDELIVVPEAGNNAELCRYEYMCGYSKQFFFICKRHLKTCSRTSGWRAVEHIQG